MQVLKGFLYFCAAFFALATAMVVWGVSYLSWVPAVLVAIGGFGLAFVTFRAARRFEARSEERTRDQFERTVRGLAERNQGSISLDAVVHATGETRESAQRRMRELMGRGVFQLDFGPNGEMLFQMTPLEESRRAIAEMQERDRIR